MADRSPFAAAVRSRSWEWLFALRKRLNVDLQLVDDGHTPLLTASASPSAGAVDSLLSGAAPGVRLAISTAIRTRTPQAASVDRLQTVVVPVTFDRIVGGALVVARRTAEDSPLERVRSELELVGFWLTNAIEAHLQSPPATQVDLDRVSALCQLLADVSRHRSDRDIVVAFVETLAVWHDLEGYGYVETTREEYVRDVALPGADPGRTPAAIARAALPDLSDVTRLAKPDTDRLGFSGGEDVVLARVGEGAGSWLVAMTGAIQPDELSRLTLYVSLLDQAVARAIQSTTAHVLATLSNHLLADSGDPEEQARQALRQIQQALGMSTAAFTVTTRTGAPLLHVGAAFTTADLAEGADAGKVVIVRRAPQQYAMALIGAWDPEHRVTQQENHVADAAADLLESWVHRLVRQSQRALDRRAPGRAFDEVLERVARDAVQGGIPVTSVVISFGDAAFRPEVTQARAVRLREHLRGSDLVGRLGDGEVGVLLYGTAVAQAGALVARLRALLEREGVPLAQVSIGMAGRNPGEATAGALAQEARQKARYHASDHQSR
jgi:hypothetical protein